MRTSARFVLLSFLIALPLVLAGCPTLKLGKVGIKDGSVSPKGFTLTVGIEVEETDETEGEDEAGTARQRQSGKGMLAINLPPGWKIVGARLQSPLEDSPRSLNGLPQSAASVAEIFPEEGGNWWAFGSNTVDVPKGNWAFPVELEIVVPKRTKEGRVSVLANVLSDDYSDLPGAKRYEIKLKGRKATITGAVDDSPHVPEAPKPPEGSDDKGSAG